jgi:hypothetical protein
MKNKNKSNILFKDYQAACENQLQIDLSFFRQLDLDPGTYYLAPRPDVWFSKLKYPLRFKALFLLFSKSWKFLGSYLYILVMFFLTLGRFIKFHSGENKELCYEQYNNVFFTFCSKSLQIAKDDGLGIQPDLIVDFTGEINEQISGDRLVLNHYLLINFRDIVHSLFKSLKFNYLFQKQAKGFWVLESYTVYNWVLTGVLVDKFKGNFIISEHYDRWAVLVDSCISNRKAQAKCLNTITLIQHGIVQSLNGNESVFNLNLPYKLKNIRYLYVYDQESLIFFENNVLMTLAKKTMDVCFFSPLIKLTNLSCEKFSVLLVGHPVCLNFHIALCIYLSKNGFNIYYKPHPATKCSLDKLRASECILIVEKEAFPKVDYLISYPSTLTLEYEQHSISSYVHPLFIDESSYEEYFIKILSILNLRKVASC